MLMNISDANRNIILGTVFQKLPIRKLGLIATVCKEWNRISSSDEVWRIFKVFSTPTPSPCKDYTVFFIQSKIPLFKYLREIPQEKLPDYFTEHVTSYLSKTETWERFKIHCIRELKEKDFDDPIKIGKLLIVVIHAFETSLTLSKIGFTDLNDVEELALKTRNTFHNPYPFLVLEQKYRENGNIPKAEEMKAHVQFCLRD